MEVDLLLESRKFFRKIINNHLSMRLSIFYDNIKRKASINISLFTPIIGLIYVIKFLAEIILFIHLKLFIFALLFSILLNFFNPPFTSLMLYRKFVNNQKNQKVIFIPLKNVSKRTQRHIVGIEDEKFYKHYGIDPEAMITAYKINKRVGYKHIGASTITQQLARNLFLIPNKSYIRKYLEVFIALELDLIIGKDRILELYLNNIEFGNGIYGIGRASLYYYKKSFYRLNSDEINRLITIIPNPKVYNPNNFYYNSKLFKRYTILTTWDS